MASSYRVLANGAHTDWSSSLITTDFYITTVVTLKNTILFDTTPCSLTGVYRRFGEPGCLPALPPLPLFLMLLWLHLHMQRHTHFCQLSRTSQYLHQQCGTANLPQFYSGSSNEQIKVTLLVRRFARKSHKTIMGPRRYFMFSAGS